MMTNAGAAAKYLAPESKPWGLHEFTAADLDGKLFLVFYDIASSTPQVSKSAMRSVDA